MLTRANTCEAAAGASSDGLVRTLGPAEAHACCVWCGAARGSADLWHSVRHRCFSMAAHRVRPRGVRGRRAGCGAARRAPAWGANLAKLDDAVWRDGLLLSGSNARERPLLSGGYLRLVGTAVGFHCACAQWGAGRGGRRGQGGQPKHIAEAGEASTRARRKQRRQLVASCTATAPLWHRLLTLPDPAVLPHLRRGRRCSPPPCS